VVTLALSLAGHTGVTAAGQGRAHAGGKGGRFLRRAVARVSWVHTRVFAAADLVAFFFLVGSCVKMLPASQRCTDRGEAPSKGGAPNHKPLDHQWVADTLTSLRDTIEEMRGNEYTDEEDGEIMRRAMQAVLADYTVDRNLRAERAAALEESRTLASKLTALDDVIAQRNNFMQSLLGKLDFTSSLVRDAVGTPLVQRQLKLAAARSELLVRYAKLTGADFYTHYPPLTAASGPSAASVPTAPSASVPTANPTLQPQVAPALTRTHANASLRDNAEGQVAGGQVPRGQVPIGQGPSRQGPSTLPIRVDHHRNDRLGSRYTCVPRRTESRPRAHSPAASTANMNAHVTPTSAGTRAPPTEHAGRWTAEHELEREHEYVDHASSRGGATRSAGRSRSRSRDAARSTAGSAVVEVRVSDSRAPGVLRRDDGARGKDQPRSREEPPRGGRFTGGRDRDGGAGQDRRSDRDCAARAETSSGRDGRSRRESSRSRSRTNMGVGDSVSMDGAARLGRIRQVSVTPPGVDVTRAAAPSNHGDASDSPPSMRTAARHAQSARLDRHTLHLGASPPHALAVSPRLHNIHAATDTRTSDGPASPSSLSSAPSSSSRAFEHVITSPTARTVTRAGADADVPPATLLAGSAAVDLVHGSDSAEDADSAGGDALCDDDGEWARMQNVLHFMTATYGSGTGDGQEHTGPSTRSAASPGFTAPAQAYRYLSPDVSAAAAILRGLDAR
jgi:hypothetical protein